MMNKKVAGKYFTEKKYYAVFEKVPAHGSETHNVILAPFKSEEEARADMVKYGYNTDNYYIDEYNQ
jgi:hypothetical protein